MTKTVHKILPGGGGVGGLRVVGVGGLWGGVSRWRSINLLLKL